MLALDSSFVMDIESEYSEREEINKKLTELESKYIPHYIGKQIYISMPYRFWRFYILYKIRF